MFTRSEKVLLAILACIQFSHIVDFMILMPLGPKLMRIFEISPHQFGLLVSAYTLAAGISGFLASFFLDHFDRKHSLMFFYLGFGLGTIACGLADSYTALLVTRSVTGAFGGVLGSLVLAIIADSISIDRRGSAIGITTSAFAVASVFGVPFSLFLADDYNWHAPFVFLGIVSVIVWSGVYFVMPPMKKHLIHRDKGGNPFHSIIHIIETPNLLFALGFMFFLIMGQFTIIPFLSPSLVANTGLPENQLKYIYLVGGVVSIFAAPLAGRLSDSWGRKKLFLLSALASAIPILIITHLGPTPVFATLACVAFFFLCITGRMVPAMATISSAPTPKYRGSFMSIASSIQQLSAAAASYLAGWIIVKDNQGHLMNYGYAGFFAVGCTLLAIYFSRKVKETS